MLELKEKDFRVISSFVEKRYGIQMPPSKKIMLQTRLQKRAMQIGFSSLSQYVDYLFSAQGEVVEQDFFATIVSTHKTEFFREIDHFINLKQLLLPEFLENGIIGKNDPLLTWSCASSTGEEVYSIAITIYDFFKNLGNLFPLFNVIGTDISDNIVSFAKRGIYKNEALSSIPIEYRHYLMRSKDAKNHEIRVVPEVRCHTDFYQQNLMDVQYKIGRGIHIIFCRNVLIYFDRRTQADILSKLINLLVPGGFLLIGHSETLSGLNLPVEQVQMTIYRKAKNR